MRSILKRVLSIVITVTLLAGLWQPQVSYAANASTYYIKINRQQNCVTVYERDKDGKYTVPVKAMVCSTGANKATPLGTFRIGGKYRWHELDGPVYGQYCSRITGHVLFHSVYYSTTDPSTLNYNAYNKLGSAVSHGCVRLCVADAKWIYDNCPSGTVVEIYDSSNPGPLGKPAPIRIDTSSRFRGWDPTDPDVRNPWPKDVKPKEEKPKEEKPKEEKPKVVKPTIKGAKNKTLERGSAKSKITSGVSAVDGKGKKLKVKVSGTYNLNQEGKYKITYSATDASGNKAKKTVTITVKDTKAPVLTINQSEITITEGLDTFDSISEMQDYFKQFVSASDSGEPLADKYITVASKNLWSAWENTEFGTYQIKVYVKDKAGNKSKVKTITVQFDSVYEDEPDDTDTSDNADTPDDTELPANPDDTTSPGEDAGSAQEPGEGTDTSGDAVLP